MRRAAASAIALLCGLLAWAGAGRIAPVSAEEVDLELVLAVDVSASMSPREGEMQRQGYIAALSHPAFLNAVRMGKLGRIAVTYVEWGGADQQRQSVDWTLIDSTDSALDFAKRIPPLEAINARGTSIANAIAFSADLLRANAYEGRRRVIDVSGDGPNNTGRPVLAARDDAVALGIVINALPIIGHDGDAFPGIERYYADCVAGGPGAFVLPVDHIAEFAVAIRRKLVLEVIGAASEAAPSGLMLPAAATDCLTGEKSREKWLGRFLPQL
jgi:hypothetical protein